MRAHPRLFLSPRGPAHPACAYIYACPRAALVIGAFGSVFLRIYVPCVPYTVAILGVGIFLGVLAFVLENAASCPTHALDPVYDWNHDLEITYAEWTYFKCEPGIDIR